MHSLRFCGTSIVTFPNGGIQTADRVPAKSETYKQPGAQKWQGQTKGRNNKNKGRRHKLCNQFNKHTKAAAAQPSVSHPVGWLAWLLGWSMATVLSLLVMLRSQQQYEIVILHVWK